jgi:predicted MFS family arabinose efflux permease
LICVVPVAADHDSTAPAAQTRDLLMFCAVIFTAMAGNANVSLKPILTGSYVEFLKFSASSAGYLLTAEATATSLATAVGELCVARWNRRSMVIASLAIIATGNILCLFADNLAAREMK